MYTGICVCMCVRESARARQATWSRSRCHAVSPTSSPPGGTRGVRDWTANIAPFWPAVARSSLKWSSLKKLRKTGLKTIRGAVAILFMILGYKLGTVKFVAVAAAKDEAPGDAKWAWSGPVF